MKTALVTVLCFSIAACHASVHRKLVVHGDSTAIGSRIAWPGKLWNLAPSLDKDRWWNRLGRSVYNDGHKSQSMAMMRDKMLADKSHRDDTTVIYDRVDSAEDGKNYVSQLGEAVSTLRTTHFLIMPQVPSAPGFHNDWDKLMPGLDKAISARWPNNTLSQSEREAFLKALSNPDTRADGMHRNAKGWQIEAAFISRYLTSRGW